VLRKTIALLYKAMKDKLSHLFKLPVLTLFLVVKILVLRPGLEHVFTGKMRGSPPHYYAVSADTLKAYSGLAFFEVSLCSLS
jgi:hypothetical protein